MFFTKNDYEKLKNWLIRDTVKDSEFPETSTVTPNDYMTLVQQDENMKINVDTLLTNLAKIAKLDFINVSAKYNNDNPCTIEEAVQLVPIELRKSGILITFKTDNKGNFDIYQFTGDSTQFTNLTLWHPFSPSDKATYDGDNNVITDTYSTKQETIDSIKVTKDIVDSYTINGKTISSNPVITKNDIQLDNVNNTSDMDKPVSTAQQQAINQAIRDNNTSLSTSILDAKQTGTNALNIANQALSAAGKTNITNSSDIELKTNNAGSELYLADRTIDTSKFISRGYKILRPNIVNGKNILTQDMINDVDTEYIINYDFTINSAITLPKNASLIINGSLTVNATINLLSNSYYYISTNRNSKSFAQNNNYQIISNAGSTFTGPSNSAVNLVIDNVSIINKKNGINNFIQANLERSSINNIKATQFSTFISGSVGALTYITNNTIEGIKNAFITTTFGTIYDCYIQNNYINGDPQVEGGATFINCNYLDNSVISGNYIDFFHLLFSSSNKNGAVQNIRALNNIFDYFYKITANYIRDSYFIGNTFANCSKTITTDKFPGLNSITDNNWSCVSTYNFNTLYQGNITKNVDKFISLNEDLFQQDKGKAATIPYAIQFKNNLISEDLIDVKIINKAINDSGILKNNLTFGTTANRPVNPDVGFKYLDTDLNQLITWDGTDWINQDGTRTSKVTII